MRWPHDGFCSAHACALVLVLVRVRLFVFIWQCSYSTRADLPLNLATSPPLCIFALFAPAPHAHAKKKKFENLTDVVLVVRLQKCLNSKWGPYQFRAKVLIPDGTFGKNTAKAVQVQPPRTNNPPSTTRSPPAHPIFSLARCTSTSSFLKKTAHSKWTARRVRRWSGHYRSTS